MNTSKECQRAVSYKHHVHQSDMRKGAMKKQNTRSYAQNFWCGGSGIRLKILQFKRSSGGADTVSTEML